MERFNRKSTDSVVSVEGSSQLHNISRTTSTNIIDIFASTEIYEDYCDWSDTTRCSYLNVKYILLIIIFIYLHFLTIYFIII